MIKRRCFPLVLFCLICFLWGSTWIPIKIGVDQVSSSVFAATRGIAAGGLLLGFSLLAGKQVSVSRGDWFRMVIVSGLAFALTYGLLFWGTSQVDSWLAAVLNAALTPLFLLILGMAMGVDHWSRTTGLALTVGTIGLLLINSSELAAPRAGMAAGIVAILVGTAGYAYGVMLSGKLIRKYNAMSVAAWTQLVGGLILLAYALTVNPADLKSLEKLANRDVLASWLYLVLFGSVIGYSCFLYLTEQWSPYAAGCYAFVSPVIAVFLGSVLLGEGFSVLQALATVILLVSTFFGLKSARESAAAKNPWSSDGVGEPSRDYRNSPSSTSAAPSKATHQ